MNMFLEQPACSLWDSGEGVGVGMKDPVLQTLKIAVLIVECCFRGINGLNSPIKKNRDLQNGLKEKHNPTIFCPQEPYFIFKDTNRLKVKG